MCNGYINNGHYLSRLLGDEGTSALPGSNFAFSKNFGSHKLHLNI